MLWLTRSLQCGCGANNLGAQLSVRVIATARVQLASHLPDTIVRFVTVREIPGVRCNLANQIQSVKLVKTAVNWSLTDRGSDHVLMGMPTGERVPQLRGIALHAGGTRTARRHCD